MFRFTSVAIFTLFRREMPKYLNEVIGQEIEENGIINAVTNIITCFSLIGCSIVYELMVRRSWISRQAARRMYAATYGVLNGLVISFIPVARCDVTILKMILFMDALIHGLACYFIH